MPTGNPIPATPDQILKYGHIAALVREALEAKGLSPADFNHEAGFARDSTFIYQVRSGKQPPSPRMVEALHKVLGINRSDLRPRTTTRMPKSIGRPPALINPETGGKIHDILGFSIDNAGNGRLKLDLIASIDTVVPLLRMLLDMGLVISQNAAKDE